MSSKSQKCPHSLVEIFASFLQSPRSPRSPGAGLSKSPGQAAAKSPSSNKSPGSLSDLVGLTDDELRKLKISLLSESSNKE